MSEEVLVELEGQLELGDFVRASYWYLFRKLRLVLIIFFLVGVVYPIMYFAGAFGPEQTGQSRWSFLIIPALVTFMVGGTYFSARRQFLSNAALRQHLRFVFSTGGFDSTGPLSSGHSSWQLIRNAYETGSSFLLFISNNHVHAFPKRFFKGAEQVTAFRQLLRSNLGSRAKLKSGV